MVNSQCLPLGIETHQGTVLCNPILRWLKGQYLPLEIGEQKDTQDVLLCNGIHPGYLLGSKKGLPVEARLR